MNIEVQTEVEWSGSLVDQQVLPAQLVLGDSYKGERLVGRGPGNFLQTESGKFVPANAPLLDYITERFGFLGTRWKVKGKGALHVHISQAPTLRKQPLRLEVMAVIPVELVDQAQPEERHRMQDILDLGSAGEDLIAVLREMHTARLPKEIVPAVAHWLRRALAGETTTVFTAVCPDYAVDGMGHYTFEELRTGVGVVAKRALGALDPLWKFCQRQGISITFVAAIGDFEADDENTCHRMGITRNEFLNRLRASQEAFRQEAPNGLPLETPFITELGDWSATLCAAQEAISQGKLAGTLRLSEEDIEEICASRRSLYQRWFGADVDVRKILFAQAPSYMALATIAVEAYQNTLILGADAPVMGVFMQGLSDVTRPVVFEGLRPVVYIGKADY